MKNLTIENRLSLFNILFEQFGSIITYEGTLIFCSLFVDREIICITQLILIPVFILYITSKFNKPVMYLEMDMKNENYIFEVALIGRKGKKITIPFKDIRINESWKWLMNYYSNVIEIKNKGKTIIVIPKKKLNMQFIDRLYELRESLN